MSALIRDLEVVNRDCSELDLIFLKFISSLLFCCSRIAICVSITFKALEGEKAVKMYFSEVFFWFVCYWCRQFCRCTPDFVDLVS